MLSLKRAWVVTVELWVIFLKIIHKSTVNKKNLKFIFKKLFVVWAVGNFVVRHDAV
jgi:hypothetical protein